MNSLTYIYTNCLEPCENLINSWGIYRDKCKAKGKSKAKQSKRMPNYCCGKIRCSKHHDNMCPLDCEHRNYCKRQIKFSETYCYMHNMSNMHNNNTKISTSTCNVDSIPIVRMRTSKLVYTCSKQQQKQNQLSFLEQIVKLITY